MASKPSWSPTTMSPGMTAMPPTETGTLISPGSVLVGAAVGDAAGIDREVALADLGDVADRAVDHHAGERRCDAA